MAVFRPQSWDLASFQSPPALAPRQWDFRAKDPRLIPPPQARPLPKRDLPPPPRAATRVHDQVHDQVQVPAPAPVPNPAQMSPYARWRAMEKQFHADCDAAQKRAAKVAESNHVTSDIVHDQPPVHVPEFAQPPGAPGGGGVRRMLNSSQLLVPAGDAANRLNCTMGRSDVKLQHARIAAHAQHMQDLRALQEPTPGAPLHDAPRLTPGTHVHDAVHNPVSPRKYGVGPGPQWRHSDIPWAAPKDKKPQELQWEIAPEDDLKNQNYDARIPTARIPPLHESRIQAKAGSSCQPLHYEIATPKGSASDVKTIAWIDAESYRSPSIPCWDDEELLKCPWNEAAVQRATEAVHHLHKSEPKGPPALLIEKTKWELSSSNPEPNSHLSRPD